MRYLELEDFKIVEYVLRKMLTLENRGEPKKYTIEDLFENGKLKDTGSDNYKEYFGNMFYENMTSTGVATGYEKHFTLAIERVLEIEYSRDNLDGYSEGLINSEGATIMAAVLLDSMEILSYGSSITFCWFDDKEIADSIINIYGIIKDNDLYMCCCDFMNIRDRYNDLTEGYDDDGN